MHQPRALLCCALTGPRRAEERGTPRVMPLSKALELFLRRTRCRTPQRHHEPPPRKAADAEPPAVSRDGFGAEQTAKHTQASGADRSNPTQPSTAPLALLRSLRASPAQGLQQGHVPQCRQSHPGGMGSLPAPPGPRSQTPVAAMPRGSPSRHRHGAVGSGGFGSRAPGSWDGGAQARGQRRPQAVGLRQRRASQIPAACCLIYGLINK